LTNKRRFKYSFKKNIHLTTLALPAIALILLFEYTPMAGMVLAFKDFNVRDGVFGSPWNGIKNFEFFFKNDAYTVTRNTVLYNLAFIAVGLVLSLLFAMFLNELKSRGATKFYQTVFFFPYFLSWVVVTYMVFAFLGTNGILTSVLPTISGLDLKEFYVTPGLWPPFLIFLNTWKNLGYLSVLYYAGIMGIPSDYYEAAEIDGASRVQRAKYITLPLLLPLICILSLLQIGQIFRADFGLFFFVPREIGTLAAVTRVIDVHVYRMLRFSNDIGMAAAVGFYQSVLCLIFVLVANRVVKRLNPEYAAF